MSERTFFPGDVVQHFKRELLEDKNNTDYLYVIIGTATHTETGEKLMLISRSTVRRLALQVLIWQHVLTICSCPKLTMKSTRT